jgi:hypothetical protein
MPKFLDPIIYIDDSSNERNLIEVIKEEAEEIDTRVSNIENLLGINSTNQQQ